MDDYKYGISLKNKLLPFIASKEIADILKDIKDDSVQNGEMNSIYGNSDFFAKNIIRDGRKNYDYIVEALLLIALIVLTNKYLYNLPLWIYSLIRLIEFSALFIGLTKDYLIPYRLSPSNKEKYKFFIIEAVMLITGTMFTVFMFILRSYFESVSNPIMVGHTIYCCTYAMIGISALVLLVSFICYFVKKNLWYGGIVVQAVFYIDLALVFLKKISTVISEDKIYVGNYCPALVLMFVFVIIYYFKMTDEQKMI